MTLDAEVNDAWDTLLGTNGVPYSGHEDNLWYEFVITLQHSFCHSGGGLLVMFSGASARQVRGSPLGQRVGIDSTDAPLLCRVGDA